MSMNGIGMIEVLVTMTISLIVFSGGLYFQQKVIQENQALIQLQWVVDLTQEINSLHSIYKTQNNLKNITFNDTDPLNTGNCSGECTAEQYFEYYIKHWKSRLNENFTDPIFKVEFSSTLESYVSIGWKNKNFSEELNEDCLLDTKPDGFNCYTLILN